MQFREYFWVPKEQRKLDVSRVGLVQLALPIMIENILRATVGLVDVGFLSRLSDAVVSGVSISNQYITFCQMIATAVATSATVCVNQALGMKNSQSVCDHRALGQYPPRSFLRHAVSDRTPCHSENHVFRGNRFIRRCPVYADRGRDDGGSVRRNRA